MSTEQKRYEIMLKAAHDAREILLSAQNQCGGLLCQIMSLEDKIKQINCHIEQQRKAAS